jgi:large-conductance mechanosensitive channel
MLSYRYYLPIWFQAIANVDALQSGIRGIPFVLALAVGSIFSGGLVTCSEYYTPLLIVSACLMSVSSGFLTTFKVGSGSGEWIGYQVLAGYGLGLGMQPSGIAAQTVLKAEDVPISASTMFFSQSLGGAIFVGAAQNVFIDQLVKNLSNIPSVNGLIIAGVGATDLRNLIPVEQLSHVLFEYNATIMAAFDVRLAAPCISIVLALTMEWKRVKQKKEAQQTDIASKEIA